MWPSLYPGQCSSIIKQNLLGTDYVLNIVQGARDAKIKNTQPLSPNYKQTTAGLPLLFQTSDSYFIIDGQIFFNGLLSIKHVWDQPVFTLLFLKLLANHPLTKEPHDAQRLAVGHLEEGRSLVVVKTSYIYFLKSLFHLDNFPWLLFMNPLTWSSDKTARGPKFQHFMEGVYFFHPEYQVLLAKDSRGLDLFP